MPKTFRRKIPVLANVTTRTHYRNPNLNGYRRVVFYTRFASLAPNRTNIVLGDDVRGWRVGPLGSGIEALAGLTVGLTSDLEFDHPTRCQDQRTMCRSRCATTGTRTHSTTRMMNFASNGVHTPCF